MPARVGDMPARRQQVAPAARLWSSLRALLRRSWLTAAGRRYFLLVYSLVVLGLVFVFSSSYPYAGRPSEGGNPYRYFHAQLAYALLGLALMLVLAKFPVSWVRRLGSSLLSLILGWGLMLAAVIYGRFFGGDINGAYCWLPWPVRWQPSEFTKIVFILFVAGRLAEGPLPRQHSGRIWLPVLGATVVTALILVAQKDLGMAMLTLAVALGMVLLGGMRFRWWLALSSSVFVAGLTMALLLPHSRHRIEVWLHPENHPRGAGLHIYSMLVALAHGGLWGQGLGVSQEKWSNLSARFTDSIYCVIGGELGLWGGLGVLALMVLLALWAFHIARRCPHRLGFFIAAGLGLSFSLQGLVNIAVATASIPPTGLTLPFISYGGSSLLSSLIGAGLILAVAAEERGRRDD